jgi:hypothetical protein
MRLGTCGVGLSELLLDGQDFCGVCSVLLEVDYLAMTGDENGMLLSDFMILVLRGYVKSGLSQSTVFSINRLRAC